MQLLLQCDWVTSGCFKPEFNGALKDKRAQINEERIRLVLMENVHHGKKETIKL